MANPFRLAITIRPTAHASTFEELKDLSGVYVGLSTLRDGGRLRDFWLGDIIDNGDGTLTCQFAADPAEGTDARIVGNDLHALLQIWRLLPCIEKAEWA